MTLVLAFGGSLLLAVALTAGVRAAATRLGIVAHPRQDRWHDRPTALLGGVAILTAFLLAYWLSAPEIDGVAAVLGAALVVFITGLVDDLRGLKPFVKLVVHVAAAASVVYFGLSLPWTRWEPVNDLLAIFWLVGITNATNLLDNMDGLAAGLSVIASAFLALTFVLNGQHQEAVLIAILAGSTLGFLFFNLHPASIFMGDCGAQWIGFMLGGVALLSDYGRSRSVGAVLFAPVLIFLIPIFDTTLVTVTRKLSGRPASLGGLDHSSHRLVALGMSEVRAVGTLFVLATASGALALLVRWARSELLLLLIPAFALAVVMVGIYLGKVRVHGEAETGPAHTIISTLTDFHYKRRVFEIILDVVLITLAYYAGFLLRYDFVLPADLATIIVRTLPLAIVIQMLALLVGGVYSGLWRYVSVDDFVTIGRSVVLGVGVTAAAVMWSAGSDALSPVVFISDLLVLLVLVCGSRLSFRLLQAIFVGPRGATNGHSRPVVIYGAGDGGAMLVREISNNPTLGYMPVGFVDDDSLKVGRWLYGCRIFPRDKLPDLMRRHGVSEVLVSSSKVPDVVLENLRTMGAVPRRMSFRIE